GRSYAYQLPVVEVIAGRAWPTLQLGLLSYAIGLLGVPLGVYAARHHGRLGDNLVRLLTVVGTAVPTWWLGLSLIVLMSSLLGWPLLATGLTILGTLLADVGYGLVDPRIRYG